MDIKETLIKKLKIKDEELGCSTGSKWFGNGEPISSFSPVDGKNIGKIKTGSKDDYEKKSFSKPHMQANTELYVVLIEKARGEALKRI